MIGITLSSPSFSKLAEKARERFAKHTGLECFVMHTNEDRNYHYKLNLSKMFNHIKETIVFFDADLWFIRDCDLSPFNDREEFFAVADPGREDPYIFPYHDSKVLGIDNTRYFNTGFYIWNQRHIEAFAEARRLLNSHGKAINDFGEQSCLNAGVQKHCKLSLLPNSYNYVPAAANAAAGFLAARDFARDAAGKSSVYGVAEEMQLAADIARKATEDLSMIRQAGERPTPVAIHAAGYSLAENKKLRALKYYAEKYTYQLD